MEDDTIGWERMMKARHLGFGLVESGQEVEWVAYGFTNELHRAQIQVDVDQETIVGHSVSLCPEFDYQRIKPCKLGITGFEMDVSEVWVLMMVLACGRDGVESRYLYHGLFGELAHVDRVFDGQYRRGYRE